MPCESLLGRSEIFLGRHEDAYGLNIFQRERVEHAPFPLVREVLSLIALGRVLRNILIVESKARGSALFSCFSTIP